MSRDIPDPVEGPDEKILNEEQRRTRATHVHPEREEDREIRTNPELSTMEQNLRGHAGVDDRGAEDGPI
jgi:hypothetical protein